LEFLDASAKGVYPSRLLRAGEVPAPETAAGASRLFLSLDVPEQLFDDRRRSWPYVPSPSIR
jgi:hypothetical protein